MMAVTLAGQVGIAIALALMVDNIGRGKQFFKTVFFFPIVISATALGLLFNLLFLYDKGMINQVLEALGRKELIDWKAEGITCSVHQGYRIGQEVASRLTRMIRNRDCDDLGYTCVLAPEIFVGRSVGPAIR